MQSLWWLQSLIDDMALSTWSRVREDITVSYASLGAAYMDHVVAIEKGYALEEGLNIKTLMSGGGVGDAGFIVGANSFQFVGRFGAQRGAARRAGEDHLHQSIAAD